MKNWKECLESDSSMKRSPDKQKAKSLIETAKGRLNFISDKEISEKSANFIFENHYSSILELLHSLVILEGYKVNNHICLGYFLRDVLNREDLFKIFDDCRFKRNSLVYYGKRMEFEVSKQAIKNSKILLEELIKILNGKLI